MVFLRTMGQEAHSIYVLQLFGQTGPQSRIWTNRPFAEKRKWVENATAQEKIQSRAFNEHLMQLLSISTLKDVPQVANDPLRRTAMRDRGYELMAGMLGVEGTDQEKVNTINNYGRIADRAVNRALEVFPPRFHNTLGITNALTDIHNPSELALIGLHERYDPALRFEAARKLVLLELAGTVDQREKALGIEEKYKRFDEFLDTHVWDNKEGFAHRERFYLVTTHDPDTFLTTSAEMMREEPEAQTGQIITPLDRRSFLVGKRKVYVFADKRKKDSETQVLKVIRKKGENPEGAIDDQIGLIVVPDNVHNMDLFQKRISQAALDQGTYMKFEGSVDTIGAGNYAPINQGSSQFLEMRKLFAKMAGMRIEIILHTNRTYADYLYARGKSHREYEIKRLFDSGCAELLFPQSYYGINLEAAKDQAIQRARYEIEQAAA